MQKTWARGGTCMSIFLKAAHQKAGRLCFLFHFNGSKISQDQKYTPSCNCPCSTTSIGTQKIKCRISPRTKKKKIRAVTGNQYKSREKIPGKDSHKMLITQIVFCLSIHCNVKLLIQSVFSLSLHCSPHVSFLCVASLAQEPICVAQQDSWSLHS